MKETKIKKVLEYLKAENTITSMDAIRLFNATRLSAIIFCLRKRGYTIVSNTEYTADGTRYVRYELLDVMMP